MRNRTNKLRRRVSLLLAVAMLLSLFSAFDLSGIALAASVTSADASKPSGKPTLYIDFLGDDKGHVTGTAPVATDQSKEQSNGPWEKYGSTSDDGTVFWIGVGIDKMTAFELSKEGRGLTGLELGFYYDPNVVEPYTNGDYKATLAAANLGSNTANQWNSSVYEIKEALTGLDPVVDKDTQEYVTVRDSENAYVRDFDLGGADAHWKMLYVSLEKKDSASWTDCTNNRFYDTSSLNDSTIYYVMMLPFKLLSYTAGNQQICFRLVRNAAVFSMGGGAYGAASYSSGFPTGSDDGLYDNAADATFGAWERETRTVGHNLKEMFSFEGDLNIFTGKNQLDTAFTATLRVSGANSSRTAKLYPSDDPGTYIYIDEAGSPFVSGEISGLTEGTGMTLKLEKDTGVTAAISVVQLGDSGDVPISTTEITAGEEYTFVMPQANVRVNVNFTTSEVTADEYRAQLTLTGVNGKAANTATISRPQREGETEDKKTSTSGSMIGVKPGETVTIKVERHPDYQATVTVKTKSGSDVGTTAGEDVLVPVSPYVFLGANKTTSTAGAGTYTFTMPTADVEVTVAYTPLPRNYAELSVNYNSEGSENNKARLSYMDYTDKDSGEEDFVEWNGKTGGLGTTNNPIPQYRTVTLDIALADGYMVMAVRLYRKNANGSYELISDTLAGQLQGETKTIDSTEYTKYLTLEMPDDTIQVAVEFARAENFNAKLVVKGGNGTDKAEMHGYDKLNTPQSTGDLIGGDDTTIAIMTSNTVTVVCTPDPDAAAPRHVKSVKITTDNYLQPTLTYTGDPNTGPITFTMPGANVTVTVTFEEVPREEYNARMVIDATSTTGYVGSGTGWPDDPTLAASPVTFPTITGNYAGDLLTGWVQVAAGWHIASVKVTGDASGNTYSLLSISGNGYNNGAGGKVVLTLSQPEESVTVTVELKEGEPDPEPSQGLTLMVSDEDNTDTENPATNWARVNVEGTDGTWTGAKPDSGSSPAAANGVTKDYNSGNGYTVTDIQAGQKVEVTFGADTDYYVDKVEVTPSAYGVVPIWTAADKVEFTQPAGPATVTVYFKKIDPEHPPYQAVLHTVSRASGESATLTSNNTTYANPYTTTDSDADTPVAIPAWPGDIFTTSAVRDSHAYAIVEVYENGNLVTWTATNAGANDGAGTFIMPAGNVDVYVEFTDTLPDPDQYRLTLTAYGPSDTVLGEAGTAVLHVDGTQITTPNSSDAASNHEAVPTVSTYAKAGQTVTVTANPKKGYIVDRIVYTPNGSVTPVELAAPTFTEDSTTWTGRAVQFTMPESAESVVVYFKKGTTDDLEKHMANITIWPPTGSTASEVGDAQFVNKTTGVKLGYSVSELAGTGLRVQAVANDGYYIREITITPASLGIASPITGIFASQTVDFVMPDADCIVNVYYEKGWPDSLFARLNVHGEAGSGGNTARLIDASTDPNTSTAAIAPENSATLSGIAPNDVVKVKLTVENGYHVELPISITDSYGAAVSYWWSGSDEISFYMPGTWVNVDVTFEEGEDDASYKATLHDGANTASLSYNGNTVTGNNAVLSALRPGDQVTVTVPKSGTNVPLVTVFRTDNNAVIATTPLVEGASAYTTTFYMQESDAEIHISMVSPGSGYLAALVATQETGTAGGGSAVMTNTSASPATDTGTVSSVGSGAVWAEEGAAMTITATPGTGYVIKSVVVTNNDDGTTVPVSLDSVTTGTYTYSYTMPGASVTAVVTFREKTEDDDKLTAQVVVNNAGDEGNKAVLRKATDAEGTGQAMQTGLSPGDQILVDLTVAPGYMVELIMATPTAGGTVTVSSLLKPNNQDQTVHFYMPADDVIVYVKFVDDGKVRYNITLTVGNKDGEGNPLETVDSNTASIHTNFSGTKGPVKYADPQETAVVKGAATEVVTVTAVYDADHFYPVVKAVSDDVNETPVSNLTVSPDKKTFTFSVPNNHVKVTVTFYPLPVTQKNKVTLHVTKVGTGDGTVEVYDTATPDTKLSYPTDGDGSYITNVPYLDNVKVDARATTGYLQAVYASINGVTLPMIDGTVTNNWSDGALAERAFEFLMQNGDVDVYVVFTDQKPAGPYTVALTVTGPDGEGVAGSAVLSNDKDPAANKTGEVKSNKTFDPATDLITVDTGDTFTVRIKPNTGYSIDTVVVTPLDLSVVPSSVTEEATGEWVYTYPFAVTSNLAVNVILTTTPVEKNTVTLHLTDPGTDNETDVNYSEDHLTADGASMEVPEREYVTISVTPAAGYYVHHAYAVTGSGAVIPLHAVAETVDTATVVSLQNKEAAAKALFVMPGEAVDVYIEYRKTDNPATGDHSAVLTVTAPPLNAGDSSVKMTEVALGESVTAPSDAGTYGPVSTRKDDTMILSWAGTIASGFRVKTITITGGSDDGATNKVYTMGTTELPTGATQLSFTIPDYDIGVIVELETVTPETYTATLHIEDHSSAIGNTVTMSSGGSSVSVDGGKLTGLQDAAVVSTVVTPKDSKVAVRAVIATDATGTHILNAPAGTYNYPINKSDVDITVIFDNADADPKMYVATVEKTGDATLTGNTAAITNTTTPALPTGLIWTGVYAKDQVRVDVTTEAGFYAVITAKTASGTNIPVLQLGTTGTTAGSVRGYVAMPDGLSENVIVTVDYSTTEPDSKYDLTLELKDSETDATNASKVEDTAEIPATILSVSDATDGVLTQTEQVTGGTALKLTNTIVSGWYIKKITLETNGGAQITLPLDTGDFVMPLSAAKLTVTVKKGTQTARPHDWVQHNGAKATPPTANTDYVPGYLIGQNKGGNQAHIQVPNLYSETPSVSTIAAFDETDHYYDYKLYIKEGGNYVLLTKGVDYEVIDYNSYEPDSVNKGGLSGTYSHDDTGWEFTIRSLKGESALTELLKDGGVLYITATETTSGAVKDESEYVEVTIPADPDVGKHTATLRIVDNSGVTGNAVQMSDGTTTVTTNGARIQNLEGDELIRTVVAPATGARVSAVTVTDSAGTRLLTELPTGTARYPYYMTGEDITVTVYFETEDTDPLTRYIAAVTKTGAIGVTGNDASIKNDTRNDLSKGTIWAEGNEGNDMRVTVKVAEGYYATVTAINKKTNDSILVTSFGAGPGVTQFDAIFAMPAADVQVVVDFTTQEPENLKNALTLTVVGAGEEGDNKATLTEITEGTPITLTAYGDADTSKASDEKENIPAGTKFTLTTGHAAGYYITKVEAVIETSPTTTTIIVLDADGKGEFTMPLAAAKITVTFSSEPRTARPYDPNHSETYNDTGYKKSDTMTYSTNPDLSDPTQEGWIRAEAADPADPDDPTSTDPDKLRNRIQITIPTLHDDESTAENVWDALTSAGKNTKDPVAEYTFYWKDSYGNYTKLIENTDIAIEAVSATERTYNDGTNDHKYTDYTFYLTALTPGGLMDYYIKNGGTIYVTATAAPKVESDYTQIVIPKAYTATLRFTDTEGSAIMYQGATKPEDTDSIIDTDGGQITGLSGSETITVDEIKAKDDYVLVGVVATTETGSVNAEKHETEDSENPGTYLTSYTYEMANADVDLQVVFNKSDDPLRSKGPHIVTVLKKNDGGLSGNGATVKDLDVSIPAAQRGDIWTVAYTGNVVRVDVTTESGYYAVVTAKETNKTSPADIQVVQYGDHALFYMPEGCDVDVTVTYSTTKPDGKTLYLTRAAHDDKNDNKAIVTFPDTSTLEVSGTDSTKDKANIAVDTVLKLATGVDADYSVASTTMTVGSETIDVPLIDGKSLPDPLMPLSNTTITVTYQSGALTGRPYDPMHSDTYNAISDGGDYTAGSNPDRSSTHQEGWLLAETDGKSDTIEITVPTLYDFTKSDKAQRLSNAYSTPTYKFYWKDEMGKFKAFTDADITVTGPADGDSVYQSYNAARLTVELKDQYSLWGGYKFADYLANGGSIYITATDGANESEKTEVVIYVTPKTYTATLYYGDGAEGSGQMYGGSVTVASPITTDGGKIENLAGTETITVTGSAATGYEMAGVVATTASGSVNVDESSGTYTYTMVNADVDLRVVFKKVDDPLKEKGPHIVTVYKTGETDGANGGPTVEDLDVEIPATQKGDIWTVAYEDNVVEVNAPVKDGYYALITARKHGSADDDVDVAVFAAFDPDTPTKFTGCFGRFYMVGDDVDVTVKYIKADDLPTYKLTLTMTGSVTDTGNRAEVKDKGTSPTLDLKVTDVTADGALTNSEDAVTAGTSLGLTTNAVAGWSVQSATMTTAGVTIDIPLISGISLPVPAMPFGDTVIEVTFVNRAQTGRPYDPNHSDEFKIAYNTDYKDKDSDNNELNPDESSTHMDGWLLAAVSEDGSGFTLTVPTLYDYTKSTDKLSHAAITGEDPVTDPVYTLYWLDELGKFQKFTTDDITITGPIKNGTYQGFNQATLTVTVTKTSLWGGYKLADYLENGGSIYITATADGTAESEKTEVVILADTSAIRPYDPDNTTSTNYDKNWITSENRGDYLIVTVPQLNNKEGTKATDVDGTKHRFQFHLQVDGANKSTAAIVNVTSLLDIVNVLDYDFGLPGSEYGGPGMVNEYYDADHAPLTYAYKDYYETGKYPSTAEQTGARFIVAIKAAPVEPDVADYGNDSTDSAYIDAMSAYTTAKAAYDANAATRTILETIISGNEGTMGTHSYRMYITADESADPAGASPTFTNKDYVDFEVPRYYTFTGVLESYAPTHIATFSLYPLKSGAPDSTTDADGYKAFVEDKTNYEATAAFTYTSYREKGTGLWETDFTVRSSALAGKTPSTGVVYKLVIQKAGHVTFTWTDLELKTDNLDGSAAPNDLTFTVAMVDESGSAVKDDSGDVVTGVITLYGGDADENNKVTVDDYMYLTKYIGGIFDWSRDKKSTDADWAISTYNPDSPAYAADLTGDGRIGMEDASIWNLDRNFAKSAKDYEETYYLRKRVPNVLGARRRMALARQVPDLEGKTAQELLEALEGEELTLDNLLEYADADQLRDLLVLAAEAWEVEEEFLLDEEALDLLEDRLAQLDGEAAETESDHADNAEEGEPAAEAPDEVTGGEEADGDTDEEDAPSQSNEDITDSAGSDSDSDMTTSADPNNSEVDSEEKNGELFSEITENPKNAEDIEDTENTDTDSDEVTDVVDNSDMGTEGTQDPVIGDPATDSASLSGEDTSVDSLENFPVEPLVDAVDIKDEL